MKKRVCIEEKKRKYKQRNKKKKERDTRRGLVGMQSLTGD